MTLMEIHTIFENRKNSMMQLLNCPDKSLALDKRKEIEGAVNEIELFLKTIEYYSKNDELAPEARVGGLKKEIEEAESNSFLSRFNGLFRGK